MTGIKKNRFELNDSDELFGGVASEMRRLERERVSLFSAVSEHGNIAAQFAKLHGTSEIAEALAKQSSFLAINSSVAQMTAQFSENTAATGLVKQLTDSGKVQQESIRRMLNPMRDILDSYRFNSGVQRALDELRRPFSLSQELSNFLGDPSALDDAIKRISSISESSMYRTRSLLNNDLFNSGIAQALKSFESIGDKWVVPNPLLESLGSLKALEERFGKITLPVIDAASAATLARMLGHEGILVQLSDLGIETQDDETISITPIQQGEGIGLSRKQMEWMTLVSFFLAVFVPIWQEYSSSRGQAATDKALAELSIKQNAFNLTLENQIKLIEALNGLVEQALVKEATFHEQRFVVLERIAEVRSEPENGSTVEGKLLPREVVRTVSEKGKWIEIEYYHWLLREYRTGWALKKYFTRVPRNFGESSK
ncbi:MAG: SH3 domain-containing protein [Betaproteobacteria bacterium]|nr:MAG: SH3 domain-containing protein [Betaproteobacteria bacterium]